MDMSALQKILHDNVVEVFVSTVNTVEALAEQCRYADTAKKAGVKLFVGVPSENSTEGIWGTKTAVQSMSLRLQNRP